MLDVVRDRQVVRRPSFARQVGQELKSLIRFPGTGSGLDFRYTRRANYDAVKYVGDGLGSGIVGACINWMARNYPQAQPGVWDHTNEQNAEPKRIWNHPLALLMRQPNQSYSGRLLIMASLISWVVNGNVYWLKGFNDAGRLVELWYIPHFLIEPRVPYDGAEYLVGYDYRPLGQSVLLPPESVIHIRHGLDPNNIRKGRSPIADVLTSVFTDDEAERFTTTLLRNYAVPGLVVAPASDDVTMSQDDADIIKLRIMQNFGDEHRGEPVVLSARATVEQFGFNPQQMDLSALRDVAEERVTAALGIPAAVVGFGAGLQRLGENATIRELRQEAWEGNGIPTLDTWAEEINLQGMPDFGQEFGSPINFGWDFSKVRALQDDEDKKETRWADALVKGGIQRSEFRRKFDLPTTPADDVYYIPAMVVPTNPKEVTAVAPEPDPNALPPGPAQLALPSGQADAVNAVKDLREAIVKMATRAPEPEPARQDHLPLVGAMLAMAKAMTERVSTPEHPGMTVTTQYPDGRTVTSPVPIIKEVLEREADTGLVRKVVERPMLEALTAGHTGAGQ